MFPKRVESSSDEDDLAGEDEAEGSQFRDFNHCDHIRGGEFRHHFNQPYMGYSSDMQYQQHMVPPPINQVPCGISSFYPAHRFDFHPQHPNFGITQTDEQEDFVEPKREDGMSRMHRKMDMPLFFLGDGPFANNPNIDPREVYCTVPGRTSLLSSTTKYRVTVGEIQRRISSPECLNASLLGGILRKAKSKDGGKTLRDSLKKIGLTLPAGRRKQANVTAWTALVEEEAVHMAKDFALVCEKEFHGREIGIYLTKANLAIDQDVVKRRTILEHSKKVVTELYDLMVSDRTPLTPFLDLQRTTPLLDPSIQQHIAHFTLMTHGFGSVAMVAVLQSLRDVIEESLKYLDRTCPTHMTYMQYNTR